ncbi:TetR/AcrR family transcriptional regulator [Rariglobus hedericola]|uniref:TetR/AcrR family transcriptional regulator n=1 Tax=Rariglobus hedericola TaxID=2597822 RepID=A0A556QQ28_9BACT|nr:helix-turn-helix domain-containing protein [Rariglobus hedericola]TSJ78719.1 TetR/AcrR family transcriptional regulator [Rariglobus hedericola]
MGRTSDASERLMTAALDLMWEESYGAVTIDDICQRAKVKKGSFYYFYESKSDLAVAALELNSNNQRALWDEHFSPAVHPLDRIRARCAYSYQKQVDIKVRTGKVLGCPLCSVGSEICNQDERIREKIQEILARNAKYWETAIRDAQELGLIGAGDPAAKARCALAYYAGMITQARIHNDAEMLRDLGEQVLAHLHAKCPEAQVA